MRIRTLLIPLVVAGAFLAGCTSTGTPSTTATTPTTNGVDQLPPDQILTKATEALKAAKSFHLTGPVSMSTFTLDLDIVFAGDDAKGKISVLGVQLEAIKAAGSIYLKAPAALWSSMSIPADVVTQFGTKWVKVPAALVSSFIPSVDDLLTPSGTPTKGDVVTVDGKQAITLKDTDGSQMHIALEGKPYPIEIVSPDGKKITFTEIDADVSIQPPAATDVFDLASIS
jgi:hypothetical protein